MGGYGMVGDPGGSWGPGVVRGGGWVGVVEVQGWMGRGGGVQGVV